MNKLRLLVIEDEENLRLPLVDTLEMEGYEVCSAASVQTAEELLATSQFSLCILDIMLPDGSGYDLSSQIREKWPQTLILILTARTLDADVETGFDAGADDYLRKPYRMRELLLRIQALLRRANKLVSPRVNVNEFQIDWNARTIHKAESEVHLTKKQFDLLYFLYRNTNKVHSRDMLLDEIWGQNVIVDTRTVDNFVSVLKTKLNLLEGADYYLKTVRGIGYCLSKTLTKN